MGELANKYGWNTPPSNKEGKFSKTSLADQKKDYDDKLAAARKNRAELTAQKRNTEGGMTAAQRDKVLEMEKSIQGLGFERAHVITPDGKVSFTSKTRNKSRASMDGAVIHPGDVIIHNHPSQIDSIVSNVVNELSPSYKRMYDIKGLKRTIANIVRQSGSLADRVGPTFSTDDLKSAIMNNASEIRVRTQGGYIYSMKRKGDSWGATPYQIANEQNRLMREFRAKNDNYGKIIYKTSNLKDITEKQMRYNATAQHFVMKQLADKFGFVYTRRKAE